VATVQSQGLLPGVLWLERGTIWHEVAKYIASAQRPLLTCKNILPLVRIINEGNKKHGPDCTHAQEMIPWIGDARTKGEWKMKRVRGAI
jgi:hypothetical protein